MELLVDSSCQRIGLPSMILPYPSIFDQISHAKTLPECHSSNILPCLLLTLKALLEKASKHCEISTGVRVVCSNEVTLCKWLAPEPQLSQNQSKSALISQPSIAGNSRAALAKSNPILSNPICDQSRELVMTTANHVSDMTRAPGRTIPTSHLK